MTKRTKVEKLLRDESLIGYKVTKWDGDNFIIPVVDVRRGEKSRMVADAMIKQENINRGSKFFAPSFSLMGYSYNTSMKR